ncbi:hypothetical protein E3N88_14381 [Mikania micrantha]|uniref:Uncharacterized protein n=1 Tax=Mikania micrantha TaxID=192012 RepID=A0A5N6P2Z9_9ASTR|nr:hypothetical protein E3N88_14381 [Mikania micrantha]
MGAPPSEIGAIVAGMDTTLNTGPGETVVVIECGGVVAEFEDVVVKTYHREGWEVGVVGGLMLQSIAGKINGRTINRVTVRGMAWSQDERCASSLSIIDTEEMFQHLLQIHPSAFIMKKCLVENGKHIKK